jgi:predicted dehydrogenase
MRRLDGSRREFLRGTAAAALAFPAIVPASALGRGGKAAPGDRVTLGHIGVGNQGGFLFGNFQKVANAQSVAVADCHADRREKRAKECGGKAYADFRELLARDDIDAVVVATPDHWHVPIAIMAAKAGKDCYVEKPLGLSIAQGLACRKAFADAGRVFQYGTQQRSQDHCRLACELVRLGKVGEIKSLEVLAPNGGTGGSTEPAPVPPGFDYAMWLGPAPEAPYTVDRCKPQGTYWIYDQSIGYLGGWGAHPLDLLVWGCDADRAGPFTVEGTGKVPETGLYDTVYDWDMRFRFANGVTMTFKPGTDSTTFVGTEGWIRVSRAGWDAEPKSLLNEVVAPADGKLIRSANHYHNFTDAVRSRDGAASPLPDAVRSDILSHLCDIAVRLERPVTWDPKAEAIVGDPEAAARQHRPMRAPWTI